MLSVVENESTANLTQVQRVQTLVIGRLIIIFLLLVTSWIWYSGTVDFTFRGFPRGPFLIFTISVGLTAVYFLTLRIAKKTEWQVRAQFILDALLVTWLVWQTGDLTSPYITLYIVLISISSLYLRPFATLMMAVICVALFILLSVLTTLAFIEGAGASESIGRVIRISDARHRRLPHDWLHASHGLCPR